MKLFLKRPVWLFCLLLVAYPTTGESSQTRLPPQVQRDVLEAIIDYDRKKTGSRCQDYRVLRTKMISIVRKAFYDANGNLTRGNWTELWTISRCGKQIKFELNLTQAGDNLKFTIILKK